MTKQKDDKRAKVIAALNEARAMELQAIYQYMNHHYSLDDWDYGTLAVKMKKIAIDEMRHAEQFAERIKDINGNAGSEPIGKITHGHTIDNLYPFDAAAEEDTIERYNALMIECRESGDSVSATLFEKIINEEQDHFNYFDNTATHIKELKTSFLAKAAGTASDD
ncbi:MAG: hypothetical protein LBU65_16590 [Planctomycetaceae bacterium]|jgi:bacterioferritin|nr:hypothetical protein [Planctomycetaceae bacterium]